MGSNVSGRMGQINSSVNLSGLVLYMPFEWGSAVDISGRGNDGTVVNAVWNATGGRNQTGGFRFDGSGDYINVGTGFNTINNVAVSLWFKANVLSNNYIFCKYHNTGDSWAVGFSSSGNLLRINDDIDNAGMARDATIVSPNVWYHVVVILEEKNETAYENKLYLNGILKGNESYSTGGWNSFGGNLYIGSRDPANYYFNGTIDEVMIFNRSLSATEILQLYNNQSANHDGNPYYTDYQNLTGSNTFNISTSADFVFPDFKFSSGTNQFYSPLVRGSVGVSGWNWVADNIAPSVSINSPLAQNYSTSSISFNITANDSSEMGSCWFNIDGINNLTLTNLTFSDYSYTNSSVPDGQYTARFYCNDSLGNLNGTESVGFGVDTVAPSVIINSPLNQNYTASNISFNVTATDLGEMGSCWFTINGGLTNNSLVNSTSFSVYNYTNSSVADGQYTARFYCNDSYGNLNNTESVAFGVDTVGPVISLISPANAVSSTVNVYNFTFNVSDESDISNCSLIFDGSVVGTIFSVVKNATNGIYKSGLNVASYRWSVNCTDVLGNEGNSSVRRLVVSSVAVASSSGGGGGGGGGINLFSGNFSVVGDSFNIRSVVGDLRTRKLIIKNLGKGSLYVKLSVDGDDIEKDGVIKSFDKIIVFDSDEFYLSEGEEREVDVKVIIPDSLGVYVGRIIINKGSGEEEIPVVINTQSKETLFDISSTPLSDSVSKGEKFRTQMYLLPVGEKGVDVSIKYLIRDYSGKVYREESNTFYVDGEMNFIKEFETSGLAEGNYVFVAEMVYAGGFASASSQFSVGENWRDKLMGNNIYLIVLVIGIISVFIIVLIKLVKIRRYKKSKRK